MRDQRPAPAPDRLVEGIVFDDVTFRYPGTDVDVLEHVDLRLPAGATEVCTRTPRFAAVVLRIATTSPTTCSTSTGSG